MKFLNVVIKSSFLFALMFAFQSMAIAGNIEGTWSFKVPDAPYEYADGEITLTKVNGTYQAVIAINYSKIKAEKLKVEKNKVTFSVYIDGMDVDVTLNIDGDKLTGKATLSNALGQPGSGLKICDHSIQCSHHPVLV